MIDLKEFAKAKGLPYDPTGKVDMSETLQAAINTARPRWWQRLWWRLVRLMRLG
jgi:hypothetical protein